MDTETARKLWIKALRSGDYKQGYGAFKIHVGDEDYYCVLGCALEVFKEQLPDLNPLSTLLRLLDLNIRPESGLYSLVELNDFYHYDFNLIADKLEARDYWGE